MPALLLRFPLTTNKHEIETGNFAEKARATVLQKIADGIRRGELVEITDNNGKTHQLGPELLKGVDVVEL